MEKQEEILLKVSELYMRYGIKSVTMDDVAQKLAISKKTLYQHVKDKQDLVTKVVETKKLFVEKRIKSIVDSDLNAIEITLKISEFLANHMKSYPPTFEYDLKKYYPTVFSKHSKARRKNVFNTLLSVLNKGIKEGLFRDDLIPEIIAKIQVQRIESNNEDTFRDIGNYSIDEILNQVFTYHLRGICSKKGLEYLDNM